MKILTDLKRNCDTWYGNEIETITRIGMSVKSR